MGRQPCCDKQRVKKGPWTMDEDKKLISFILTNGHCCWRSLPKLAGLRRCGKSCRLRWTNYLRPDVKRGLLTDAEEQLVIELHARLGNRWSKIAARLPGRTDNEIKNHWNTYIKKKLIKMGIDPVTHEPLNIQAATDHQKESSSRIADRTSSYVEPAAENNIIQVQKSSETFDSSDDSVNCSNSPPSAENSLSAGDDDQSCLIDSICNDDELMKCLWGDDQPQLDDSPWKLPAADHGNLFDVAGLPAAWEEENSLWLLDCQDFGIQDFGFDRFNEFEAVNTLSSTELADKQCKH
ncbi:hypothetical protein Nepgr_011342 [Nepenthes gracilis]|uniref:Uncharacterized protein n=1 Tax=Nepenthes gracilis TaxID=150966 RepID=A0AAD3SEZ6_NEPGR|nr:hypothetical protein Nepgr_011342 [Nepenthes gracilis]